MLKGHYKVSSGIPQVENAKFPSAMLCSYCTCLVWFRSSEKMKGCSVAMLRRDAHSSCLFVTVTEHEAGSCQSCSHADGLVSSDHPELLLVSKLEASMAAHKPLDHVATRPMPKMFIIKVTVPDVPLCDLKSTPMKFQLRYMPPLPKSGGGLSAAPWVQAGGSGLQQASPGTTLHQGGRRQMGEQRSDAKGHTGAQLRQTCAGTDMSWHFCLMIAYDQLGSRGGPGEAAQVSQIESDCMEDVS
ncbi:unnamed protein product [Pleuronectes platessa]|uniref:Uncharacterized protein n=1 Tax=Pleuronectes platessa TaxID=8262 RepID=A0A9N7UNE2_PLEPL|nr:unnamed protein product [Pleuronectes platessa]